VIEKMPIYEYRCEDCTSSFETLVRPGHDEKAQCPSCHGDHLTRQMSVFAARGGDGAVATPLAGSMPRGGGGCCGGSCGCG
jgi:putative FmdB family regulatory protein